MIPTGSVTVPHRTRKRTGGSLARLRYGRQRSDASGRVVFGRRVVEAVRSLDRAPERKVGREEDAGRSMNQARNPRAVHGPIPDTSGRVASTSSSVMSRERLVAQTSVDEPFRRRARLARRAENPLSRSACGSAASSSAGDGRCPQNRSCGCEMIARIELTDSM